MVARTAIARIGSAIALVAATAMLVFGVTPGAAHAAARVTTIKVAGPDVPGEIVVQQQETPRLFAKLMTEVDWLFNETPHTGAPGKGAKLGPKYTMTVLVRQNAVQVYHLYPLATGGPRAHRPADQPSGKKAEGWFYGRLTMPETLRVSGVPLDERPDVINGGIGGGFGEDLEAAEKDPAEGVGHALTEMRRLLLINGGVLVVILVGLAGMAFLIRRRV